MAEEPSIQEKVKKKRSNPPPPPLGNKRAVGNSGRPKVLNPVEEAKALLEWAQLPDSVILLKFSALRGYSRQRFSEWFKECPVFADAYQLANELVAFRREEFVNAGSIEKGVFNRYQGMYDKYLNAYERAEKEHEYTIKAKLEAQSKVTTTPEEQQRHDSLMAQIRSLQYQLDRNMEEKSKSTDNKS